MPKNIEEKTDNELWEEALEQHGVKSETDQEEEQESEEEEKETKKETKETEEQKKEEELQSDDDLEKDDFYNKFLKGKSTKEMVDIIKNNNSYVSQVKNELHEVKQQLNKLSSATTTKEETKALKALDKLKEKFKEEDVNLFVELVNESVQEIESNREKARQEQSKQENLKVESQNEDFWDMFESFNGELAKEIQPVLLSKMKEIKAKDGYDPLYKKNFVKDFCKDYVNQKNSNSGHKPDNKDGLVRKKRLASTANGGGSAASSGSGSLKGKPIPDDPDEYLKWLEDNKGIKI